MRLYGLKRETFTVALNPSAMGLAKVCGEKASFTVGTMLEQSKTAFDGNVCQLAKTTVPCGLINLHGLMQGVSWENCAVVTIGEHDHHLALCVSR